MAEEPGHDGREHDGRRRNELDVLLGALRRATTDDVDGLFDLRADASRWFATKGIFSSLGLVSCEHLRNAIREGITWVIPAADGSLVATITVADYRDPVLWEQPEHPERAVYVEGLLVRRDHAGIGLGGRLLDVAGQRARASDRSFVRLATSRTNAELHRYFIARGFRLTRIVERYGVTDGALFERWWSVTTPGLEVAVAAQRALADPRADRPPEPPRSPMRRPNPLDPDWPDVPCSTYEPRI